MNLLHKLEAEFNRIALQLQQVSIECQNDLLERKAKIKGMIEKYVALERELQEL